MYNIGKKMPETVGAASGVYFVRVKSARRLDVYSMCGATEPTVCISYSGAPEEFVLMSFKKSARSRSMTDRSDKKGKSLEDYEAVESQFRQMDISQTRDNPTFHDSSNVEITRPSVDFSAALEVPEIQATAEDIARLRVLDRAFRDAIELACRTGRLDLEGYQVLKEVEYIIYRFRCKSAIEDETCEQHAHLGQISAASSAVISNTRTGGRGLDSSLASLTAILGTLKV
jgi:hypothetical protein